MFVRYVFARNEAITFAISIPRIVWFVLDSEIASFLAMTLIMKLYYLISVCGEVVRLRLV
jgi:hypothetical protein